MAYHSNIKQKIKELEEKIAAQQGNIDEMTRELNRLKLSEFEEDMRLDDDKKLLLG
jgi:uncharacterized coiled-coil protein SlyX